MAAGIFQMCVGAVAIIFGLTGGEFYAAFMRRPRPGEKPMAKWLGRTIFLLVGVGFIIEGILSLRHH